MRLSSWGWLQDMKSAWQFLRGEPHQLELFLNARCPLAPAQVQAVEAERDVVRHAEPGKQAVVLEHQAAFHAGARHRAALDPCAPRPCV